MQINDTPIYDIGVLTGMKHARMMWPTLWTEDELEARADYLIISATGISEHLKPSWARGFACGYASQARILTGAADYSAQHGVAAPTKRPETTDNDK